MIFIENFANFLFFGLHLKFLKMLKGENFTPTWISLYTPVRVIIKREKKFITKFWVRPKMCFSLPDYNEIQSDLSIKIIMALNLYNIL